MKCLLLTFARDPSFEVKPATLFLPELTESKGVNQRAVATSVVESKYERQLGLLLQLLLLKYF
jgi:hypothetical protein